MASLIRSALSRRLRAYALLVATAAAATACASATAATSAPAFADPTHSDADKYRVVFENSQIRVLRYHDEPGASTHPHHHPCLALYALGSFERELTLADGTRRSRRFRAGETAFMPAQSHVGHNVGSTPTEALLIEFKAGCS